MKLNKLKEQLLLLHSGVILTHIANAKEPEKRYRKHSGLPYGVHITDVMKRVSHYGYNFEHKEVFEEKAKYVFEILGASCAHDIEEDTTLDIKDFRKTWGNRIADIVHECTRVEGDAATRIEKWNFLCSFLEKSKESVIIKIADRYCNVMDYMETDPHYAGKYALEAYPLYVRYVRLIANKELPNHVLEPIDKDVKSLLEIASNYYGSIVLLDSEKMLEQVKEQVT